MTARFAALIGLSIVAFFAAISFGAEQLAFSELLPALLRPDGSDVLTETILWTLRMPRALLALLVGAGLAVAGTITQAIMRNPLAEPGILGINAGAALAAMLVIVEFPGLPAGSLQWLTFLGALIMTVAIYALSWQQGTTSLRIILVGLGLSALAGAGASFIATFGPPVAVQRAMVWMAGTLQESRWEKVELLAIWLTPTVALVWLASRELNLAAFDDDIARGLGQRVNLVRGVMVLATAAICGAAVAAAGLVAFVGLAGPHIARRIVGHRHEVLIPAAALTGAILVAFADTLARSILPPIQLPVGLVTGLIGAPFFGWLLWRQRNE